MPAARSLLLACLSFAAAPVLAQGGPDELWSMTMRMEMAGMQLPAQSQQVCMKKGETQPQGLGQRDGNCKVTDQSRSGNKFTWKVVCTGAEPMTGTGELTRNRDTLEGRMLMKGKEGEMKVAYSGKLSGTCDAKTHQDPQMAAMQRQVATAQAQSNAQLAQMCRESMEKYATQMFEGEAAMCKAQKPEYCAHVRKTVEGMRMPAGYRKSAKAADWEQVGKVCKVSIASARADACKSAVGGRDWSFVAGYCPAEAKKIAAEHCAGRDYTVAMSSEYKAICGRYASPESGERPAAAAQPAAAPAKPAAPSAADAVKEGASQLRKLFGR